MLKGVFVKCSGLPGNTVRAGPVTISQKAENSGVGEFPRRVYSFPRTQLENRGRAEMTGSNKQGAKKGVWVTLLRLHLSGRGPLLCPCPPPQFCTVGNGLGLCVQAAQVVSTAAA